MQKKEVSKDSDGDLDMRMNQLQELDAHKVINSYPEDKLRMLFFSYGELKNSKTIAPRSYSSRRE